MPDRKKYIRRAAVAVAGGAALYLFLRWARRSDQAIAADTQKTAVSSLQDDYGVGSKFQDCLSTL